ARNAEASQHAELRGIDAADDIDDGQLVGFGGKDGESARDVAFAPAVNLDELASAPVVDADDTRPRARQLLADGGYFVRRVDVAVELEDPHVDAVDLREHGLDVLLVALALEERQCE